MPRKPDPYRPVPQATRLFAFMANVIGNCFVHSGLFPLTNGKWKEVKGRPECWVLELMSTQS